MTRSQTRGVCARAILLCVRVFICSVTRQSVAVEMTACVKNREFHHFRWGECMAEADGGPPAACCTVLTQRGTELPLTPAPLCWRPFSGLLLGALSAYSWRGGKHQGHRAAAATVTPVRDGDGFRAPASSGLSGVILGVLLAEDPRETESPSSTVTTPPPPFAHVPTSRFTLTLLTSLPRINPSPELTPCIQLLGQG